MGTNKERQGGKKKREREREKYYQTEYNFFFLLHGWLWLCSRKPGKCFGGSQVLKRILSLSEQVMKHVAFFYLSLIPVPSLECVAVFLAHLCF